MLGCSTPHAEHLCCKSRDHFMRMTVPYLDHRLYTLNLLDGKIQSQQGYVFHVCIPNVSHHRSPRELPLMQAPVWGTDSSRPSHSHGCFGTSVNAGCCIIGFISPFIFLLKKQLKPSTGCHQLWIQNCLLQSGQAQKRLLFFRTTLPRSQVSIAIAKGCFLTLQPTSRLRKQRQTQIQREATGCLKSHTAGRIITATIKTTREKQAKVSARRYVLCPFLMFLLYKEREFLHLFPRSLL